MLCLLWQGALALISQPCCPACGRPFPAPSRTPAAGDPFCSACGEALALPATPLQGDAPLPWHALAPYQGKLRSLLLRQRPSPQLPVLRATFAAISVSKRLQLWILALLSPSTVPVVAPVLLGVPPVTPEIGRAHV